MYLRLRLAVFVCLFTAGALIGEETLGPRRAPGLDGHFAELASHIPGFGGYFFDEHGDLIVHLTDLSQASAARAAFAGVARERGQRHDQPWTRAAEIVVRQAAFDFSQLSEWESRVMTTLRGKGTYLVDINEVRNAVVVGVTDEKEVAGIVAASTALGVPPAALVVEVVDPTAPATLLTDYVRPLVGGLLIDFTGAGGAPSVCTLGVNVWYTNTAQNIATGTAGFLTASHCSTTWASTDSTVYSQGGSTIGYERWDPPTWDETTNAACTRANTGNGTISRRCRWSDVAFAQYDAGVSRSQGYLARTMFYGTTSAGSRDIDPNNPTFRITGTRLPVVGMYFDKVGKSTGWTTGPVPSGGTCVNLLRYPPDVSYPCQTQVNGMGAEGDSGSPVFYWSGSTTVSFAGILHSVQGSGSFYFSNIDQIRNELGGVLTYTP